MKLSGAFYLQSDVVHISRELLGKKLCTRVDGAFTSGIITETEAYAGTSDRASHAWNNRRTARTEVMYSRGGVAYVYLCYGIHHLFNVVTNDENIPHAVLIRAIEPLEGIPHMLRRRGKAKADALLATGPGRLSQALDIKTRHSGCPLSGDLIWIEDCGVHIPESAINCTPRIGVGYAGEDAGLPYRFRALKLPL